MPGTNAQCCKAAVETETMLSGEISKLSNTVCRLEDLVDGIIGKISVNLANEIPPTQPETGKDSDALTIRADSIRSIQRKIDKLNDTLESIIERYQG